MLVRGCDAVLRTLQSVDCRPIEFSMYYSAMVGRRSAVLPRLDLDEMLIKAAENLRPLIQRPSTLGLGCDLEQAIPPKNIALRFNLTSL